MTRSIPSTLDSNSLFASFNAVTSRLFDLISRNSIQTQIVIKNELHPKIHSIKSVFSKKL